MSGFLLYEKNRKKATKLAGAIKWLDSGDSMIYRGAELLSLLQQNSDGSDMGEEQVEFAIQLAEFEDIHNELEADKLDLGASFLTDIPKPLPWVTDPRPQPHLSIAEARLAAASGYNAAGGHMPKIQKNGDVFKSMCVTVNASWLSSPFLEPLRSAARSVGLRLRPAALPRGLLCFERLSPGTLQPTEQGVRVSGGARCRRALLVAAGGAAARLLAARALRPHVAGAARVTGDQLTLIVLDTPSYFKKGKPKQELELAQADLLVSLGVDTVCLSGAGALDALAARVLAVARALSDEPHKMSRRAVDEQAQFYMRGDNKQCVTVDAHGNGLERLWQQMLAVLPQAGLERARALAARCPAPRALHQSVSTVEGLMALSELGVARSTAPGARARRLGRGAGGKLHAVFTAHGHEPIDD